MLVSCHFVHISFEWQRSPELLSSLFFRCIIRRQLENLKHLSGTIPPVPQFIMTPCWSHVTLRGLMQFPPPLKRLCSLSQLTSKFTAHRPTCSSCGTHIPLLRVQALDPSLMRVRYCSNLTWRCGMEELQYDIRNLALRIHSIHR